VGLKASPLNEQETRLVHQPLCLDATLLSFGII